MNIVKKLEEHNIVPGWVKKLWEYNIVLRWVKKFWEINIAPMWSLLVGLSITGRYFFKRELTVHYPRKVVDNLETFRGPIELIPKDDNPSKPRCIACMNCVTTCPHECITVVKKKIEEPETAEVEKGADGEAPPKKKAPKEPERFAYDYTLCVLCGLCEQNCPADSIRFSNRAYLAGFTKEEFIFDLLAPLRKTKPL